MSAVAGAGLAVLRSELLAPAAMESRELEDTQGRLQVPSMMSRLDKLRPRKDLGTVIDLWQDRFFVLCPDRLLYFKSYNAFRAGKEALGVIPLAHAWLLLHGAHDLKPLEFLIRTPFRDYRMRARAGHKLLGEWIEAFAELGIRSIDPNGLDENLHRTRPVSREMLKKHQDDSQSYQPLKICIPASPLPPPPPAPPPPLPPPPPPLPPPTLKQRASTASPPCEREERSLHAAWLPRPMGVHPLYRPPQPSSKEQKQRVELEKLQEDIRRIKVLKIQIQNGNEQGPPANMRSESLSAASTREQDEAEQAQDWAAPQPRLETPAASMARDAEVPSACITDAIKAIEPKSAPRFLSIKDELAARFRERCLLDKRRWSNGHQGPALC
jgi:hypothetical protein